MTITFLGCDLSTFKSRKQNSAQFAQDSGKAEAEGRASQVASPRSACVCVRGAG